MPERRNILGSPVALCGVGLYTAPEKTIVCINVTCLHPSSGLPQSSFLHGRDLQLFRIRNLSVCYYNGWKTNKAHYVNTKCIIPTYTGSKNV